MAAICRIPECTFAETGTCLENNVPDECPNRLPVNELGASADLTIVPPPLAPPAQKQRFPSSLTLGKEETSQLMSARYCRVIGILGAPDSGKTASLASLFLLLSREKLTGFRFADSRTLMALNEIAQGARQWNRGSPPEQMTVHTKLAEDRDAGFLHIKLKRTADDENFDFLLPDIPGEWSDTFIDKNRVDRLLFLKAVDAIWLMADGRKLAGLETRKTTIRRLDLLLARIAAHMARPTRVLLVLSHRDSGEPATADIEQLKESAAAKQIDLDVVPIASFKRKGGQTIAGFGIADLITKTIGTASTQPSFWPEVKAENEPRAMLRFRSMRLR